MWVPVAVRGDPPMARKKHFCIGISHTFACDDSDIVVVVAVVVGGGGGGGGSSGGDVVVGGGSSGEGLRCG